MAARDKNSAANVEPWASDGTSTQLMFEVAPGFAPTVNTPLSSNPFGFFVKNNSLYFFASSNTSPDLNLYKLDELATSLELKNAETELKLYPNPVNDQLTVEGYAEIFDVLGNKLAEGNNQINMSELPAGIYLVECKGRKTKIIKN